MPTKLYGFYLKRDKTHYMYLDNDVVLAVPDSLLEPTAEAAEYIRISFEVNFDREDSIHSGRDSIKFFSRSILSDLEALTPQEFSNIAEMAADNLVYGAWARPENYTILFRVSRYFTYPYPYKRGVIIQLTEELLRGPPLSDISEIAIKRNIPKPQFAVFGKL